LLIWFRKVGCTVAQSVFWLSSFRLVDSRCWLLASTPGVGGELGGVYLYGRADP
jgi:hypothetical protein